MWKRSSCGSHRRHQPGTSPGPGGRKSASATTAPPGSLLPAARSGWSPSCPLWLLCPQVPAGCSLSSRAHAEPGTGSGREEEGGRDYQHDWGTLPRLGSQSPRLPAAGAVERKFRRDSLFCPDELDSLFSYFDAGAAAAGPRSKCREGPGPCHPTPLSEASRAGPGMLILRWMSVDSLSHVLGDQRDRRFLQAGLGWGWGEFRGSSRDKAEIASQGSGVTWPLTWRPRS